jgi:hypothetical protein
MGGFHFHDLGCDFASRLVVRKVELYVFKESRHSPNARITERHSRPALEHREAVVIRLVRRDS